MHVTRITKPGASHPIEPQSVVLLDPATGLPVSMLGARNDAIHGVLSGPTEVVEVSARGLPASITLRSVDLGRKIEISTDGGTEYFQPSIDQSSASMIVLVITAPVSHIKFIGAVGDVWRVQ